MISHLRVEHIGSMAELPLKAAAWNSIAARCPTASIFQTHEWIQAWWSACGVGQEPYVLLVWDGGSLAGIAPLMLDHSARRGRELRFIGSGNSDYLDFIVPGQHDEVLLEVCRHLVERRADWDSIYLENLPQSSPNWPALQQAMADTGMLDIVEAMVPCFEVTLSDREIALTDQLAKYRWRRPVNWFRRHGDLQFHVFSRAEDIEPWLDAFYEQHTERWKGQPSIARFADPMQRQLIASLVRLMDNMNSLSFAVLLVDGRPLAFHFGFVHRGRLLWYKPSFDVRFRRHSPGAALFKLLLEFALASGMKAVDLTVGDEEFKRKIADSTSQNIYLRIHGGGASYLRGRGIHAVRRCAAWCKRLLLQRVN